MDIPEEGLTVATKPEIDKLRRRLRNNDATLTSVCVNMISDRRSAMDFARALQRNNTAAFVNFDLTCHLIGLTCHGNDLPSRTIRLSSTILEVNLSGFKIGNGGAALVAQGLRYCSQIQDFNLRGNGIREDGLLPIVTALYTNVTTLKKLDLSSNDLDTRVAECIGVVIARNPKLVSLSLSGTSNRTKWPLIAVLAPVLSHAALSKIDLSYNYFGYDGAVLLGKFLAIPGSSAGRNGSGRGGSKGGTSLTELDLSFNCFTAPGVAHIAHGLRFAPTLKVLDLSRNCGWDEDASAFAVSVARVIRDGIHLDELVMQNSRIEDPLPPAPAPSPASAPSSAPAAPAACDSSSSSSPSSSSSSRQATTMPKPQNHPAATVSDAIRTNTTLTVLDLSDNAIGDVGCSELCDALLHSNHTLKRLLLGRTYALHYPPHLKRYGKLVGPQKLLDEIESLVGINRRVGCPMSARSIKGGGCPPQLLRDDVEVGLYPHIVAKFGGVYGAGDEDGCDANTTCKKKKEEGASSSSSSSSSALDVIFGFVREKNDVITAHVKRRPSGKRKK